MPEPVPDVVEQVRTRLDGVSEVPLAEQVPVYDAVHRLLQDALARLDEG